MFNTLTARPLAVATPPQPATHNIPSIRLISATPSATGTSSEANTSLNRTIDSSWASIPSPLAPKAEVPSRKRLVPKKSKLSLLGVGREKERGKDLSDVVRRVGATSSSKGGFEIYVDPTVDPDIGEIVMVKKKKSRVALDGMKWGPLGEVTNVPSVTPREAPALLKVKNEEKEKWWSIGRGRKDSKEKTKEAKENKGRAISPAPYVPVRSKTPEPLKLGSEARARFNSLDSGILLNSPPIIGPSQESVRSGQTLQFSEPKSSKVSDPPGTRSRSSTPTIGGLLAPPSNGLLAPPSNANQGSIALRAIRSVRSLARIGSWNDKEAVPVKKEKKDKASKEGTIKEGKKKKKEKKTEEEDVEGGEKKKKKKEKKDKTDTVRLSTSSFEAGALTASPEVNKTLGRKKHSILGLGLPSTMRLQTVRNGSTASSIPPATISGNRLSVESTVPVIGRDRAGSTISTGSSLRPVSVASSLSRASSGSSCASVKWDEEGLETVREQRKRERASKNRTSTDDEDMRSKAKTESRHSLEGRKRTPLSEVFPEIQRSDSPAMSVRRAFPILTIEEATADGHGAPGDEELLEEERETAAAATPVKKARVRPMSEQLLGRSRPKPIHEDEDGVLSILDAATNELALLINNLDLEATPCTPDLTPLRPSPGLSEKRDSTDYTGSPKRKKLVSESPLKNGLRGSLASISSLRPYAQSRGKATRTSTTPIHLDLIGQQIAPWPTLIQSLSPLKESPPNTKKTKATLPSTFRKTHKRTMTPGPEPEPDPIFHPLGPPKARVTSSASRISTSPSPKEQPNAYGTIRAPSSLTFGSRSTSSRPESKGSIDEMGLLVPGPVFTRSTSSTSSSRKRSSLTPLSDSRSTKGSRGSQGSVRSSRGIPIPPEARKVLGMGGTMGGSEASGYAVPELDASDPDSDVPDELRIILAGGPHSDRDSVGDTFSFPDQEEVLHRAFTASPDSQSEELPVARSAASPFIDMPVFRASLMDEDENLADLDEGGNTSEEDNTKKSFDFTGELKKLNESGGSDRRSFVEQLENAFKTPAKVDLRYDFGAHLKDGMLHVEVPPVPKIPVELNTALFAEDSSYGSSGFDSLQGSRSRIVDMKEPTMLQSTRTEQIFETGSGSQFDVFPTSRIVDVVEPSMLLGPNSFSSHEVIIAPESPPSLNNSLALSTYSAVSSRSDGELDTSFRFGGRRNSESRDVEPEKPMTLSDIIPSPSHARSLSNSSLMDEGDSVFKSILAKAANLPQRPRVEAEEKQDRRDSYIPLTRPSSGVSFGGLDSFEEVRRGFEFNDNRPAFYPPPATRRAHRVQDSVFSIASVSSYGRVLNAGSSDPFDYGLPSLQERPSCEDMSISMSITVDDTFSFLNHQPRRRIDSDASSFYFQAPQPFARGHRRHESNLSISSQGPPISRYNRSHHRRNDSNTSASSVAISYAMHGATGGRATWARHRQESSVDSVMSDFSAMHLGRPGLGDKMFERDNQMPLSAIAASPCESVFAKAQRNANRSSFDYDSIIDHREGGSNEDSLFDRSEYRSSMSSDLFGNDFSQPNSNGLLPAGQFRPLSIISMHSAHAPMEEDDTMISMLGGGHVRRCSIGSIMEASPCVRVEKRKHALFNDTKGYDSHYDSSNKARIVEKPSIASTSSYQFGGERMIKAQHGLLERQSLEDSCLIADGEDLSNSFHAVPVFTRPGPAARSRSSTCTSSSGGDTPPLSASDGSSISEGSQSSIDLSQLNMMLSNATHPMSTVSRARARARARGHGHRRRYSQAHASRSSVYETIEEEMSNASSPARTIGSKKSSPTQCQPIFVVDSDTASINSVTEETIWDDERGIVALRKYYALKDEAHVTVVESKRQWLDTPFSVFALQSFQPPKEPLGMQALLEYSVQNYGPLPSELRPRRVRSRTQSRPSPYPQARLPKVTVSPEQTRSSKSSNAHATPVLKPLPVNANTLSVAPSLEALKPFSPLVINIEPKRENAFGLAARPRVASSTRRSALGWSKRSNGKASTDQKENQGAVMTPGESLRLNRPRPRGRATPATQGRPIRV